MSEGLRCEEAFSQHMYPIIDPWCKGVVNAESFSFLDRKTSTKSSKQGNCREQDGMQAKCRPPKPIAAKTAQPIKEIAPAAGASSALNMLSNLSKYLQDVDKYLQPVPEEFSALMKQPQERRKPKRRHCMVPAVPRRSASMSELSSELPP